MENFKLKYGKDTMHCSIPHENLIGEINGNEWVNKGTEKEVILDSLHHPINSARLKELVHKGETVSILVSDNTRLWQKMYFFLPYIIDEILEGGVREEDITFIIANGAHRMPTKEEHEQIIGKELYKRFKVLQHDCNDQNNLVYLGTTTRGTPVKINKVAMESDHIILTGAIVYHFLCGWAGGKKSIIPGISSYETIIANHSLSLTDKIGGDVTNPNVRCGNIINNPLNDDMIEVASFVRPTFMFNVVIDSKGDIAEAVSGNYLTAHEEGRNIIDKMYGVNIEEKADLVISSAGGFPKDCNLYQSNKAMISAREAVKEGGTVIAVTECSESLGGNEEFKDIFLKHDSNSERENELRTSYSISKFTSFYICDMAEKYNLILVSSLDPELLRKTNVKVVKTLDEALELTYKERGEKLRTYIMYNGPDTLPKLLQAP